MSKFLCSLWVLLALPVSGAIAQAAPDMATNAFIGERLASVLRAGRGVVAANQDLINDPARGDKGLTGDAFLDEMTALYQSRWGEPPLAQMAGNADLEVIKIQLAAMKTVIDESQGTINAPGVGFKGFIPAVFARLVNERFAENMNAAAVVKVTAPLELVRNRKARPDDWETKIIDENFRNAAWEKGAPYFEEVTANGETVFRMIFPEYYTESCLSCHGGPAGEMDVTGFPKEGGALGELAGAISIILRQ
ncbi:MAG: DUF3365 domain-containing protein [Albidovulum sp.]